MFNVYLLSFIVFLPALGAIVLAFLPSDKKDLLRFFTLVVTLIVLAPVLYIAIPGDNEGQFDLAASQMQDVFTLPWIPSFDIQFYMGLDGISFPLVALTAVVSVLACGASWSIEKHVKAYCILFLLLETGMLGVFLALDFFLFYVFWEVMLLPMYFLIGVWGGPRKEYAALKFFLYTLLGSVLMLVAILMLYFASDLKRLNIAQLETAHIIQAGLEGDALRDALKGIGYRDQEITLVTSNTALTGRELDDAMGALYPDDKLPLHTFNIIAMQQMGQHTPLFTDWQVWNISLQHWAFWLLFIGFAIKVPSVPVHTWLPDAHVEAPTPISMILAGVLLKMGGYGILRMCYPICPVAGYDGALVVTLIGVVSMVYGAFAALAQNDFKRMVAYSSVSHMGYVVLGLGVWSMGYWSPQVGYNPEYWNMGVKGAMFQMIAHGISSAGMFFMVGVIYDRVHHRNLNEFGGLFGKMPGYTAMAIGLFFAGLGLPGLCGFVGEVLVVFSVWNYNITLAVISASVVVLTAAYILWAVQRVYLGAEYKGPHADHLHDMKLREWLVAVPLFVLAILFGVLPHQTVLKYMDKTIDHQTSELAAWTRRHDEEQAALAAKPLPPAADNSIAANR